MKNLIFSLIVLAFFINNAKAQNPLDDFTYQVYYQTTSIDTAVFDPLCTRVCKVTVPDTNLLSTIHVQVGSTENGTEILNYSFQFDYITGLPTGLTYLREQNVIYLGLYTTLQSDMYYYAVSIEDTNGNISVIKKWH